MEEEYEYLVMSRVLYACDASVFFYRFTTNYFASTFESLLE